MFLYFLFGFTLAQHLAAEQKAVRKTETQDGDSILIKSYGLPMTANLYLKSHYTVTTLSVLVVEGRKTEKEEECGKKENREGKRSRREKKMKARRRYEKE